MKQFIILLLLLLNFALANAQRTPTMQEKAFARHPLAFIENKGQITDQYGNARHDIAYKTGSRGMSIFVGNGQLHYQWSKAGAKRNIPEKTTRNFIKKRDTMYTHYTMYRLDMTLAGANPHAQLIAEGKQTYYENYRTAALHSDNATVSSYNKITYRDIYPGIDWVLYIKDKKLEYDFIVRPNGNVNDIKIQYDGGTDIAHTNGNIKVTTPMGDVSEQQLCAYEQGTCKHITAGYTYKDHTIGFSLATATDQRCATIVIDPTLAWGTYFGGQERDDAFGTACDNNGNVYLCGFTESVSDIATAGAYQTVYNGNADAYVAKFNSAGSLSWATYYGGESEDIANGITCDKSGNVFITGETYSIVPKILQLQEVTNQFMEDNMMHFSRNSMMKALCNGQRITGEVVMMKAMG